MSRALALLLLGGGAAAAPLRAQVFTIGVHGALGDYREVSSNLRYRGEGGGASVTLHVGRLTVEGVATRVSYDPRDRNAGLEGFKATQIDARLGVDVAGGVTAEIGVLRRTVDPQLAAQDMGAARIGVRYAKLIGPGATVGLRGHYLAGAKFTGEGSAGLAFELGLFVSVGPQSGRYRFTADYGFQRVDRKVGGARVPLEQSLARLGVAVGF